MVHIVLLFAILRVADTRITIPYMMLSLILVLNLTQCLKHTCC